MTTTKEIDTESTIRKTIGRLQDFLNNPASKYTPDQIWTDDFHEKRRWPFARGTGREEFVELLNQIHQGFSDYQVSMPLIISEGDNAAVRMVVSGTHTGEFQGIQPNHRSVHWEILAHMKFRDGLICEQETFRDWMELMSQLQWPLKP